MKSRFTLPHQLVGLLVRSAALKVKIVGTVTCKGRGGVASFYARRFSISQLRDGGAYLLSVALLSSKVRRY